MGAYVPAGSLVRTGAERATLVRRTYGLVFVSILVTVFGAIFTLSQPALLSAIVAHPIITMFSMFIPLLVAGRASFPANVGFVLLFNLAMGAMLAFPLYVYGSTQPGLITEAAGLTIGAFGVLTVYAFVSRRDFSAWGSFFIVGLFILLVTMVLNAFVRNQTAGLWLASASVLVFSGLLVFDTWRLRNVYGPDDFVQAGVQIYLDLLNMFLAILRILGNRRN